MKTMLKSFKHLTWALFIALFAFTACDDDDDNGGVLVEDGAYVVGEAAGLPSLDPKGLMMAGRIEGEGYASTLRDGMYEKFVKLEAGKGFKITTKAGTTELTYGAKTSEKYTSDGSDYQITTEVDKGTIEEGANDFTVSKTGFYHVVVDITTKKFYIIPVNTIGCTVTGDDQDLTEVKFDGIDGEWEFKDYKYRTNDKFKFRYNDNWKLKDEDFTIFTNFGTDSDLSKLFMGGGEYVITGTDKGQYDLKLTWNIITGFKAEMTNKRAIANTDFSAYDLGLIGNGLMKNDTDEWGWDATYEKKMPTKDGEVYTWSWTGVKFQARGEDDAAKTWKFRKGEEWAFTIGYTNVTMAGSAKDDFFKGADDGNFGVKKAGAYDLVLKVDADTDAWTLTAEPAAK